MKTTTLKAAAAFGLGALLMGSAAAQESVSKPVGYETITVDLQFNYMGLRLLGAPLATSTVATAENDEITLTSGTVADGPVIIEVIDGDAAGAVEEGTASGGVISVPVGLLDNLEVDNTVTIRNAQTLSSVFGDPIDGSVVGSSTGLDGAVASGGADLIYVPDGTGGFDVYWYSMGFLGAGAGWKQLDQSTNESTDVDASQINLIYTDAVVIENRGDANSVVVSGSVKTTGTALTLSSQFNYLSTVYPAGATLATAFNDAETGDLRAGSIDAAVASGGADLVYIPDGAGAFNVYWYSTGFLGAGAGWKQLNQETNESTDVDPATISLDSASAIVVENRGDLPQGVAIESPSFYADL